MNWEDMRHILALFRAGTFSGAAQDLGVVRTTVGRRLRTMEADLGVRLFDQTPEGFLPTAAGADLVEVATRVETEMLAAEARVKGQDAALHGALRVSTLDFVYQGFVDVFHSFIVRYPGVNLSVCATYDNVSLRRREADIALRLSNNPDEHLVGRRLGELTFGIYGQRELVERIGVDAAPNQFPWLGPDKGSSDDGGLDELIQMHAPGAKMVIRLDGYPVLRASINAGMGIHFLPCLDGDADPGLLRIGEPLTDVKRYLWVLTLPELRTNIRVRALMDHFYEAFRDRVAEDGSLR